MMMTESRSWLLLALLVAGGWLVYLLAPVITPFAISAVLAYFGDPVVDRLERVSVWRWKVGRTVAVVIVFMLMLAFLTVILLILIPLLADQVRLLVERFPQWVDWFSGTVLPWVAAKLGFELATWLTHLILIPVVTFYLLRDWDLMIRGIHDVLPRSREAEISALASEVNNVLGAFFRGQLMVMLALGVMYSIGLSLVGIELAVLIGMGAGLLSIVPYLGSIVGFVVATGAAIFQFHDWVHPVLVMLVFAVGQSAEGMYLTPKLVGDQIGLHPVTVIFAVLAGGQLFGFLGILLALPVAAALNVLVRHAHQKYRQSDLYNTASSDDG